MNAKNVQILVSCIILSYSCWGLSLPHHAREDIITLGRELAALTATCQSSGALHHARYIHHSLYRLSCRYWN